MTTKANTPALTLPVGARDHARGRATAPVTLVEYGDYECPYCGEAYPIVKELQEEMGDTVRFVFRNFPLTEIHPHAGLAAQAAEAAGKEGHFWEMHDLLFENQETLDRPHLVRYGSQLGMDPVALGDALERGTFEGRVQEDFLSGVRSGVNGTPTFFVNGFRHDDAWDLPHLAAAVRRAARTAGGSQR